MRAIGVRELKTHASEIMRKVREERVSYTITYRGKPVGVLLPLEENGDVAQEKEQDPWSKLEKIREKMALMPRPEKTLAEALSEMRR
ncbi:MAG: type II toxin-antitoxin system Phd/YefM family antitoxin [Caldilineaceae bacterium]|nr:type II toxin-antitoxin system Phd/YefM family antitoxin [Caldilineaceae bacterium]MDE0631083.1 type II toxin-antitoxin system Phd/YefM family antitoxin [Caldilineaceae bacterium]